MVYLSYFYHRPLKNKHVLNFYSKITIQDKLIFLKRYKNENDGPFDYKNSSYFILPSGLKRQNKAIKNQRGYNYTT